MVNRRAVLSFCLAFLPDIAPLSLVFSFAPSSAPKRVLVVKTARYGIINSCKTHRSACFRSHHTAFDSVEDDGSGSDGGGSLADTQQSDTFNSEKEDYVVSMTRRDALSLTITTASSLSVMTSFSPDTFAASADGPGSTPEKPIVILGGGGRSGMAVAECLISSQASRYVVTTTRTGKDPFQIVRLPPEMKQRLSSYDKPVDVNDVDSIRRVLKDTGASGVVFAASASKAGGNASQIDDVGVENAAIACRDVGGARLVVISALAVDRPKSKSYDVTNFMGGYVNGIMDAKLRGENKVRLLLKDYVVVRPGVLLSGKTRNGALDVELNQGDTIGGGLSRDELAGVVWGAMVCGKKGVTVEAYRKTTRTKLQPEFIVPSGNELTADTYVGLFENAKSDA
uniref:NAD(P)-binding domain-containing protein n=1 Tax=Helicotheca tamesis TaxID=374047 RepID=A0A7S2GU80_9STRA|mmetsp:Transcript_11459/g.15892  ORF Transcript_11459/g.15892 Transcript_11459/m.15892 type:complete len:397 (+) Transcript_11459:38-1228(+)